MKFFHLIQIPLCWGLATIASGAVAQELPQNTAQNSTITETKTLGIQKSWREDARLNAKVTLQAKRISLADFLTALSAQSGLVLDGGDLATTKRVTLSVRDMELRDAMNSLEIYIRPIGRFKATAMC